MAHLSPDLTYFGPLELLITLHEYHHLTESLDLLDDPGFFKEFL